MGKCNLDQCEDCQGDGACHHLPAGYEQLHAVYYRLAEAEALAKEMVAAYESCDQEHSELQARVVQLRAVLAVRDAERDALQAWVVERNNFISRQGLWGKFLEEVPPAALEKERDRL